MKNLLSALSIALVAAGIAATPSYGATVNPTETSSLDWMRGDVTDVQFDQTGRLWAWNTSYNPEYNDGYELHVFDTNGSGDWVEQFEYSEKKFDPNTVRFDSDNRMYVTNSRYGTYEILIVSFNVDGSVDTTTRIKYKKNKAPFDVYPTDSGHVFMMFNRSISEYILPLTKKSKPIRTINTDIEPFARLIASDDGTIYVTQGSTYRGGVDVFTPSQRGTVSPDHSFTISPSYSTWYPSDITFTSTGRLAVCVESVGVAIFPTDASGTDVVPMTWYPGSSISDSHLIGVDFDDSGVMAVADQTSSTSIKWFFE